MTQRVAEFKIDKSESTGVVIDAIVWDDGVVQFKLTYEDGQYEILQDSIYRIAVNATPAWKVKNFGDWTDY